MSIYMAFPVVLFYYFNQPQYFEKWVIEKKRELYPPAHLTGGLELQEFIKKFDSERKKKLHKELDELEKQKEL